MGIRIVLNAKNCTKFLSLFCFNLLDIFMGCCQDPYIQDIQAGYFYVSVKKSKLGRRNFPIFFLLIISDITVKRIYNLTPKKFGKVTFLDNQVISFCF